MENFKFRNALYAVDDNYIIHEFNDTAKNEFPDIAVGATCYKAVRGLSKACDMCPLRKHEADGSLEWLSLDSRRLYKCTFSNATLRNGSEGYAVSINISDEEEKEGDVRIGTGTFHKTDIFHFANFEGAYAYLEINLTKDLVTSDMVEVVDGIQTPVNIVERGGPAKPMSLTDFSKWRCDARVVTGKEEYRKFAARDTLLELFGKGQNQSEMLYEARSSNGYPTWHKQSFFIKSDPGTGDVMALCIIRDVNVQQNKAIEAARTQKVMKALASTYSSVIHVDAETEIATVCVSNPEVRAFMHDEDGHLRKYTQLMGKMIDTFIIPADRAAVKKFSSLANIAKAMKKDSSISMMFRRGNESNFRYFDITVVNASEEGSESFVVAFSDINDSINAEREQQKKLNDAILMAQRDTLTGVKNRAAYDIAENKLNRRIQESRDTKFAIVMFDINFLKYTNDTFGHEAGDALIMKAASLIGKSFPNSPVFRVGGDEFIAILTDEDYNNRDALMANFRKSIADLSEGNRPDYEKLSISSGIAVYYAIKDKSVSDVQTRADMLMYQNKAEIKLKTGYTR